MLNSRVRLRHLRTFLEVARRRSVVKAAAAMHVSQPAVTRTIRELEEVLGVALLEREGRGIRLTHSGEVFLQHAGIALAALRQGIDSVAQADVERKMPLRIGALPTVSAHIMPRAVALFLREETGAALRIVTGENSVLLEQLRLGELDLVVGRLAAPERMTGFLFEHLYSEQVVFVVRAGHPLLADDADIFARLEDYPVLMPTRGSIIWPFVQRLLIANGVSAMPGGIETVSDAFGRAFLRQSDAVWIISQGVVCDDIADGTLCLLDVDTSDTKGQVGLTMRTNTPPLPAFPILLATIREAARLANGMRA